MADLVLTIPFGLQPELFPWGAEVIRKYLEADNPNVDVNIWDLHDDEQILAFFEEYRDCISEIIDILAEARLNIGQRDILSIDKSKHWARRSYYAAAMLKFGKDLFHTLASQGITVDEADKEIYQERLKELKQAFESIIQNKTREYLRGRKRVLFGISIYDITLFESMEATKCMPYMMREMKALTAGHPIAELML